ncbi:dolichyl pyrophosphate Man9GlcNAc2 alpha-1,3-glucosyltransferase [Tetranychus urticae]|uniref:Alpha-1,3-glucosyltransferase n=1 Tax=Tetranychus urticae TaxID=32264 RepID=T1JQ70_TETUR|nr:dolichyl pyrophosphate Man9GlcNAc2 alpha-1,3-glucosyltransferase [Tetranychus urticae]
MVFQSAQQAIGRMDSFLIPSIILNFMLRWLISRFSYSGARNPPLYGDYEAQRHWQEITYNLQPSEWYKNSTDNDLLYWGLDYPPLTAYHSWVNGFIGKSINESWVRLHTSRGTQGYDHKIFMRSTVLISDVVIYFTGLIYYFMVVRKPLKPRERGMLATIGLMYPALILIDHGHFQYNCVSLGFTVWAVVMLMSGRYFLGSVFYCLALNYKQMSLYYSFSFFFFLLGICFQYPNRTKSMITLATISSAVIMTFIACWFPFIWDSETFLSVVYRLFPISRGLYEDKVANIWCSLEVLIKLKRLVSASNMAKISAITTLICLLPSSFHLFKNPTIKNFIYNMAGTSLIFFLLSFQVHEKTILLAALPVTLLIHEHPFTTLWFYIISTFSLLPLMAKDGLIMPSLALTCFSLIIYVAFFRDMGLSVDFNLVHKARTIIFVSSICGCLFLTLASTMLKPPSRYPHIYILLNSIYSCFHFIGFTFYYHYLQFYAEEPELFKVKGL